MLRTKLLILSLATVSLLVVLIYLIYIPVNLSTPKLINIPHGTPTLEVARRLEEEGVIKNRLSLLLIHALYRKKLQSGEYEFKGELTPLKVYEILSKGKVKLYTITVPEGSDLLDVADILHNKGITDRGRFLTLVFNPATPQRFGIDSPTMEGFLFPDTYRFPKETAPEKVVEVMFRNFLSKTRKLRAELGTKGLSLKEWVIVASMIERETALKEEKPLIAAVIYNRLSLGMKLQIDPTVIYSLKLYGKWDGKLKPEDLKVNSLYNTYIFNGLPPTPICNPGLDSLEAALYPADVDYLYFVADGKGGHLFSRSYEQHLKNIKRIYRR